MIIDQIYSNTIEKKAREKTKEKSESQYRSLIKAISWRILGSVDTILLSWLISGNISIAFSIGAFEFLTKTILYYFHERIWNSIKWGK